MSNPSHVDRIRLKNSRVRNTIQRLFELSDERYCQMQYEFYTAYVDAVFPDEKPELQAEKRQFLSNPGIRAWFVDNWNKKDIEFLDCLDFDILGVDGLYCLYHKKDAKPDTFMSWIGFTSVEMLFLHYQAVHRFYGIYDAVPRAIYRKINPVQTPSNT